MTDLSKAWPLGLNGPRWWAVVGGGLALLGVALAVDRQVSVWARGWPAEAVDAMSGITRYGESDWILYPSLALFAVTGLLALAVRWKLMKLMLIEQSALFGFVFLGVGAPSLVALLTKSAIGRARPTLYDKVGAFDLQPSWFDWTYQGFPSGHATTAFALAAVLGFLSPRWFLPAIGFAALIGVSRVVLGAHYPSDVIGGAMLGLLGAYAMRSIFASRKVLFRRSADGSMRLRPLWALRRYLSLKQRRNAPAPPLDRP